MKRKYRVETALGSRAWRYQASYQSKTKAELAVMFWKTQKGAVNGEPFDARIIEKEGAR